MRLLLAFTEWLRDKGGQVLVIGTFGVVVLLCLLITWAVLTNRVTAES